MKIHDKKNGIKALLVVAGILIVAAILIYTDSLVQELKEKTRCLEASNQELKDTTVQLVQSEKLSALGELTAGVAHELNQPLNGIKIIAQSLLRDIRKDRLDVEELDQELAEVVFQVDKMSEIIDHMRTYSRRTEGSTREMIDVNSIIDSANKFLYQQLTNHNIKVVKQTESDLPQVLADPIRLEQVVTNLITNARKALDSAENGNKTIEIKTYKNNGSHVVFEVSDNGAYVLFRSRVKAQFDDTGPATGTSSGNPDNAPTASADAPVTTTSKGNLQ